MVNCCFACSLSENRLTHDARKSLLELEQNFSLYKFTVLEGNALQPNDLEGLRYILNRNLKLRYMAFTDSYSYRSAPWNRGKVVVVGNSGVGKTSTVRALVEEFFLEHSPSTVGIRISLATSVNTGKWQTMESQVCF